MSDTDKRHACRKNSVMSIDARLPDATGCNFLSSVREGRQSTLYLCKHCKFNEVEKAHGRFGQAVDGCVRHISKGTSEKAKIRDKVDRIVPLSRIGQKWGVQ